MMRSFCDKNNSVTSLTTKRTIKYEFSSPHSLVWALIVDLQAAPKLMVLFKLLILSRWLCAGSLWYGDVKKGSSVVKIEKGCANKIVKRRYEMKAKE